LKLWHLFYKNEGPLSASEMLHHRNSSAVVSTKTENHSEGLGHSATDVASGSQKLSASSFAGLSLSAKQRTRLLIEVTAFVSAVSKTKHQSDFAGSDVLSYEETVRSGKQNKQQPWVEILYRHSQTWFQQVPDKELSLAVDILRRTRNMIRNRFTGALSEKSCELPARVTISRIRARNLEPRDYKHSPGSYCVIKMDGLMYRTSSHKSLNPVWDEEFEFIVQDVESVMSISVHRAFKI
jgi:hypothetical protein